MEEKEKVAKKGSKKIVLIIIAIIVLIFLLVAGFIFYHGNQTGKLISEVNKIAEMQMMNEDGSMVENPIDMEIKTTGSYAVIEKTFKDYVSEVVNSTKDLAEALDEEKIMNLVSIENMQQDGPDFVNSKQEVENMKQAIEEYITKFQEYANEDNLLSKIDDKDVSDYYKELYKTLAVDEDMETSLEDTVQQLNTAGEEAKQALDDLNSIFNFLSENKDDWQIEDGQIVFNTESSYEEYNSLMSSLETMQE